MSTQPITGEIVQTPPSQELEVFVDKHGFQRYKASGRLLPGQPSINPTGRPQARVITEALKEKLAKGYAEKLADKALKLASNARRDSDKLSAIQFVKDSTEGKAVQAVAVQHSVDETTMKRIAELSERFLSFT